MKDKLEKPSPEVKALSLFLMAYKTTSSNHKEKSKRINKRWSLVQSGDLSMPDYLQEVQNMLTSFGGYSEVIEKTVRFYVKKTGEWKLKGTDKYCVDAQEIADKLLNK